MPDAMPKTLDPIKTATNTTADETKISPSNVKTERTDMKPSTGNVADTDVEDKKSTTVDVKEEQTEKEIKPKEDNVPYDWATELMKDYIPDLIENSPKMEIFFCILSETIRLGDRMLIFSQSLLTLNVLERFLQANPTKKNDDEASVRWAKNYTYFRKCSNCE